MTDTKTSITLWNDRTIPRLGMGCWAIGGPFYAGDVPLGWGEVDDNESIAAVHRALDLGIRFFDTAANYGAGHSEEILGKALDGHGDVMTASKFGHATDPETRQMIGQFADETFIRTTVETSLRRLRREQIDLLQFHLNDFPLAQSDEVFDSLERLRTAGKIAAYGWSTDFPERARRQAPRDGFVAVQHDMNVFVPASAMLGIAEEHGLVSINRSPLMMGILSGKFHAGRSVGADDVRGAKLDWNIYFQNGQVAPDFAGRLAAIRELLMTGGRTTVQGALGWIWAKSDRTLPIPGFRTVAQVEENAGALAKGPLPATVVDEIDAVLARPTAA
jgi:aryl-alcohol dehydrogenase-like predicted oxidoreductase